MQCFNENRSYIVYNSYLSCKDLSNILQMLHLTCFFFKNGIIQSPSHNEYNKYVLFQENSTYIADSRTHTGFNTTHSLFPFPNCAEAYY
jgi:hypothetical protein